MFTPIKVAHVIPACENRLLTSKVIEHPFTIEEIRGGALAQYLIMDDYYAPLKVINFFLPCGQAPVLKMIFSLISVLSTSAYYVFPFSSTMPIPQLAQIRWLPLRCLSRCRRRKGRSQRLKQVCISL